MIVGLVLVFGGLLLLLHTLEVIDEVTVNQVGALLLIGFGVLLIVSPRRRRRWLWLRWDWDRSYRHRG